MTEKTKDNEYIIKAKLSEKDKEISGLREKYGTDIALLKEAMRDMQQLLKNPEKLVYHLIYGNLGCPTMLIES